MQCNNKIQFLRGHSYTNTWEYRTYRNTFVYIQPRIDSQPHRGGRDEDDTEVMVQTEKTLDGDWKMRDCHLGLGASSEGRRRRGGKRLGSRGVMRLAQSTLIL